MTIRSGGRPRDTRAQQARPYDPDAYATDSIPEFSEPVPGPRGGGGRGGHGIVGFLKFLVFALVLAGVVLAVALTALRPVVASTVMSIAEDNPAALKVPFVEGIVRENLGTALTAPARQMPPRSSSWSRRATRREASRPGSRTRVSSATAARSSSSRRSISSPV